MPVSFLDANDCLSVGRQMEQLAKYGKCERAMPTAYTLLVYYSVYYIHRMVLSVEQYVGNLPHISAVLLRRSVSLAGNFGRYRQRQRWLHKLGGIHW